MVTILFEILGKAQSHIYRNLQRPSQGPLTQSNPKELVMRLVCAMIPTTPSQLLTGPIPIYNSYKAFLISPLTP